MVGRLHLRITAAWILAYLGATGVWIVGGETLPGGRWLAVHLFTLGVLTNAVLGFSAHFAQTLSHRHDPAPGWWSPVLNLGSILVLVGIPSGTRGAVVAGSTVVTFVVMASYLRLRRLRRGAPDVRFTWVLRAYERAHGAFVHGALIGALIGTGVLAGQWYPGARLAHLHVNLLGWGGLTLLATVVFLGPAMARTRILPGSDRLAGSVLRHGATGLTVAMLGLLASGAQGTAGTLARVVAAGGLAAYAAGATVICGSVARAALGGRQSFERNVVVAICAWLTIAVWGDAVVVLVEGYRYLDALGVALILGVLAQAVLGALSYFGPQLVARERPARDALRQRMERAPGLRILAFNLGTVLLVWAAAGSAWDRILAPAGWGLVGSMVLGQVVLGMVRSRTAASFR